MKITIKKKESIKQVLEKFIYIGDKRYIDMALEKIVSIHDGKTERSLAEHKLYFVFCDWLSKNMPEALLPFGLEHMTSDTIHNIFKCKFKINSTSFGSMTESSFNEYFKDCVEWTSSYILRCNIDDLKQFMLEGEI